MSKTRLVLLGIMFLIGSSLHAGATSPGERVVFSPVQKGFSPTGAQVLPYASDHIQVQFTQSAMRLIETRVGREKGASIPAATTGLPSVDAIGAAAGAVRISRPDYMPKNRVEASRLGVDRWFRVDLQPGADIPEVVARYAADPNVEYAAPAWIAFPTTVPSDPQYTNHWGHNNTGQLPAFDWNTLEHTGPPVGTPGFDANAEAAWDNSQGFGSSSIVIAILDTGVDLDHPDLDLVPGYDFGDNDSDPDDNSAEAGHGTACAGVAASTVNNALGACGIAAACRIMPCKVADSAGILEYTYIQAALIWAADNGADIISMSFGAAIASDPQTDAALEYAHNAGVVLLAATSNYNQDYIEYPANHADVIGVGAASPCGGRKRSSSNPLELNPGVAPDPNGYTCDGERWWGSNYGSATPDAADAVDVLGPTILPTTDVVGGGGLAPGDYEPFFNGTSCATPYAAGVCALIKSQHPYWTNQQIRDQLCDTAIDIVNVESVVGWDRYSGYGMVDANYATGGIPDAAIDITRPSGGERWVIGDREQIRWWTCQECGFTSQDILVSQDNGATWDPVFEGLPASKQFQNWTVSGPVSATTRLKVVGYGPEPAEAVSETFIVDCFEIAFVNPPDGQVLQRLTTFDIETDEGAACDQVTKTYELTIDGGSSWQVLGSGTGDVFHWYINEAASTNCKIRVTATNAYETEVIVSGVFTIDHSSNGGGCKKCPPPKQPVDGADLPTVTRLIGNSPNPFNPTTTIRFELAQSAATTIQIYNVKGELVREADLGTLSPGTASWVWDGTTRSGQFAGSGIYFVRLVAGSYTETAKMVLLK